jgi:hypothetical protein
LTSSGGVAADVVPFGAPFRYHCARPGGIHRQDGVIQHVHRERRGCGSAEELEREPGHEPPTGDRAERRLVSYQQ